MKKKILAVIMTIALVIGLVPTVALARESDKTVDEVLSAITENDLYVREDGYFIGILYISDQYAFMVQDEEETTTYMSYQPSSALSVAQSNSVYTISGFGSFDVDFIFENGELTKIVLPSFNDWAGSELSGTYSLYRISDSEMTWSKLMALADIEDEYYPIASTGLYLYQSIGICYSYTNEEYAYTLIGNAPTTKIKEVCKDKIYEVTCINGTFVILIENEKIVAINAANSTVIPNDTYVINYSSEHTHVLGTAHTGVSGLRDYYDCTDCSAKKVGDTWTSENGYHWHAPTCGHELDPEDCDGYGQCEDKTTVDNKCDVCGVTLSNSDKTYMDIFGLINKDGVYYCCGDYVFASIEFLIPILVVTSSDFKDTYQMDELAHAITTKVSDSEYTVKTDIGSYTFTIVEGVVTKVVLSGVTALDGQKVLDGTYLPPHTHTFAAEWTRDGGYHWHESTCGCNLAPADCDGYAACSGGTATCQSAAICKDCGKAYGTADANAHTFSAEWTSDGTYHWHAPTCGHEVVPSACPDYAACSGGTATCTSGAICGECGNAHGEIDPNAHPFSEEWTSVGGYHWHDVTCEHEIDVTEFVEKSNYNFCTDSDDDGFCDVCGEKLGTQSSVEVFVDSLSKLLSGEMSVAEATEAVVTAVMENVRETITQITEQINETISNAVETIRNIFSNLFGGLFGR